MENVQKDLYSEIGINWKEIILKTSYWVSKDTYDLIGDKTSRGVYYPFSIRIQKDNAGWKEINNEWLFTAQNQKPQDALSFSLTGKSWGTIKKSWPAGKKFTCCHIYDKKNTKDWKTYTNVANLILVPQPLKSITDHDIEVVEFLKRISYTLYDWKPENSNVQKLDKDILKSLNIINTPKGFTATRDSNLIRYFKDCPDKELFNNFIK